MQFGMLTAETGRFTLNLRDAKRIMSLKDGLEWDFALNDGGLDPNYCKSHLVITKFERDGKNYCVEGSMVYNRKPRRFKGIATKCEKWVERIHKKTGLFECKFEYTEPSADLSEREERSIVQRSIKQVRKFLKKKTA